MADFAWIEPLIGGLASAPRWSYNKHGAAATEPAALASLALLGHGRTEAAQPALDWLVRCQTADGSLGVSQLETTPCWPTGLAILAWTAADRGAHRPRYAAAVSRAVESLLAVAGVASPRAEHTGHDTTLVGWPWVAGTHSWVEPTAFAYLALRSAGYGRHPRAREALLLLQDRLLDSGGSNYGNTVVLGQELLPHVQPTGIALLALVNQSGPKIDAALRFLEYSVAHASAIASLCFGLMGLAAHDRLPRHAAASLQAASVRALKQRSPYKQALVALAALERANPLIGSAPLSPAATSERQVNPRFSKG